ncbi:Aldehyde dehydrogenase family [Raoultella ornithinolytica]|nr:Aldehyde dehydrogenase family [Raoultella ornithinolytica]
MNSGQACIAGTRILVPAGRLAEFEQAIVQAMADYISGDPRDAQDDNWPDGQPETVATGAGLYSPGAAGGGKIAYRR